MKTPKREKPATREPLEERFNRFARALMAVPKKEIENKRTESKRKPKRTKQRLLRRF